MCACEGVPTFVLFLSVLLRIQLFPLEIDREKKSDDFSGVIGSFKLLFFFLAHLKGND